MVHVHICLLYLAAKGKEGRPKLGRQENEKSVKSLWVGRGKEISQECRDRGKFKVIPLGSEFKASFGYKPISRTNKKPRDYY